MNESKFCEKTFPKKEDITIVLSRENLKKLLPLEKNIEFRYKITNKDLDLFPENLNLTSIAFSPSKELDPDKADWTKIKNIEIISIKDANDEILHAISKVCKKIILIDISESENFRGLRVNWEENFKNLERITLGDSPANKFQRMKTEEAKKYLPRDKKRKTGIYTLEEQKNFLTEYGQKIMYWSHDFKTASYYCPENIIFFCKNLKDPRFRKF